MKTKMIILALILAGCTPDSVLTKEEYESRRAQALQEIAPIVQAYNDGELGYQDTTTLLTTSGLLIRAGECKHDCNGCCTKAVQHHIGTFGGCPTAKKKSDDGINIQGAIGGAIIGDQLLGTEGAIGGAIIGSQF